MNRGLQVDDYMEPSTGNIPLVHTPDADTLLEWHVWGWDGINFRAVVAQNQNKPSFKTFCSP